MNGGHFDQAVFVIDDDGEIRRSLEYLFESVGLPSELFENAEAFLHRFDPSRSGCLMIDVRMPGMGGLRLLQQLNSQGSHLPVIVFTGHANVSMAVQAIKDGAFHFLEKPAAGQEILHVVQDALALDRERLARAARKTAVEARLARLTPREHAVLEQILEGNSNKCIAMHLGISERTIEKHREQVMNKMGTRSLAKLIRTILIDD